MNEATLRLLVSDARKVGATSVNMSVRVIEDLADLLQRLDRELSEAQHFQRDAFAAAALQSVSCGVIAEASFGTTAESLAAIAYEIADAMLRAREQ